MFVSNGFRKHGKGSRMNLANNITVVRILLIPFFVEMMLKYNQRPLGEGEQYRWAALAIFSVAVITDALDGLVARVFNQITEFGKALDPVADKLLLMCGIILLSVKGHLVQLPLWFVVTVISRDLIIVIGALLLHLISGRVVIAPNILGKATTVAQMVTLGWILLGFGNAYLVWRIAGVLTVASGVTYIVAGTKQIGASTTA